MINASQGMDAKRVAKFGKYFSTIDFEAATVGKETLERMSKNTIAGTFYIGGKQFEVTWAELEQLEHTVFMQTK